MKRTWEGGFHAHHAGDDASRHRPADARNRAHVGIAKRFGQPRRLPLGPVGQCVDRAEQPSLDRTCAIGDFPQCGVRPIGLGGIGRAVASGEQQRQRKAEYAGSREDKRNVTRPVCMERAAAQAGKSPRSDDGTAIARGSPPARGR